MYLSSERCRGQASSTTPGNPWEMKIPRPFPLDLLNRTDHLYLNSPPWGRLCWAAVCKAHCSRFLKWPVPEHHKGAPSDVPPTPGVRGDPRSYRNPSVLTGSTRLLKLVTWKGLWTKKWSLLGQCSPDSSHFTWAFSKTQRMEGKIITLPAGRCQDLNAEAITVHRRPMSQSHSQHREKRSRMEGEDCTPPVFCLQAFISLFQC